MGASDHAHNLMESSQGVVDCARRIAQEEGVDGSGENSTMSP